MIRVLVVDDHPLFRAGLSGLLATVEDVDVVDAVGDGESAVRRSLELGPDVVLMDLNLPGLSGVAVIERLAKLAPASRVLVLTRAEHDQVVAAIVAGASGYILKTSKPEVILAAVVATAAGEAVLSSQIAGRLLERIREQNIPVVSGGEHDAATIRAALTPRELQIFARLASGETNGDIGRELALSRNTVANHIASILAKLQLENRIQAAVRAVRSGIS